MRFRRTRAIALTLAEHDCSLSRQVDASQDAARNPVLRLPSRPFRVLDCPPATLYMVAFTTMGRV